MASVTQLMQAIDSGDRQAAADLLPLVYRELKHLAKARLATEQTGQTLQATDLVHEAYKKLVDTSDGAENKWNSLGHFFGAAAEAMRRILIDRAREKSALKRGGNMSRVEFDAIEHPATQRPEELLHLDAALSKLEAQDERKAQLVKLRYFVGLTTQQAADALRISRATADRDWAYARVWLKAEIGQQRDTYSIEN